ncbi:MAG: hypothetical protein R3C56_11845 [Pirellulaceae bacterium]
MPVRRNIVHCSVTCFSPGLHIRANEQVVAEVIDLGSLVNMYRVLDRQWVQVERLSELGNCLCRAKSRDVDPHFGPTFEQWCGSEAAGRVVTASSKASGP